MKVLVKYLRHGALIFHVSDNFIQKSLHEQMCELYLYLSNISDEELVYGMSSYAIQDTTKFFDDIPPIEIHGIEVYDTEEILYESKVYTQYWEYDAPGLMEFLEEL